jgi:fructose/tagatose bisphosphate aldolase
MAIVRDYGEVQTLYRKAGEKGWVIPCFCAENLTTIEAVLAATAEYGEEKGIHNLPITLALTVNYSHRSQACFYTHTRNWRTGLDLFTADVEVLAGPKGTFKDLDVMIHLDHIQHDLDQELLSGDLSAYSSIMYDASALPFEENIRQTKAFVERVKGRIYVEGACDEIFDATGQEHNAITQPDHAGRYFKETGVDLIVANLGTEHRASAKDLKYYSNAAQAIRKEIGSNIVLHGTSSVSNDQVAHLYEDGICKVNIWTALERDASPILLENMVKNAVSVGGNDRVKKLRREQYLGSSVSDEGSALLSHFTTVYRQDIIYHEMKKIVRGYLDMWYKT